MKEILLTMDKVAVVDDEDYDRVKAYKWRAQRNRNTWYAIRSFGLFPKQFVLMHRFILDAPPGMDVDHRNGNGLINTRSNIRIATKSQNQQNRPLSRGSLSGYKGVIPRLGGRWGAQIKLQGKIH